MRHLRGFTTVEMIIVVTLMGVILGITLLMGWGYLQTIQYRQEKELLVGMFDDTLTLARTSSYYKTTKYDNLDMSLSETGIILEISTGSSTPMGGGELVSTYRLQRSHLEFSGDPLQFRMEPYELNCEIRQGLSGFQLVSDISDQTTCFQLITDVCKIKQTGC